jgi:hypothetical protein
VVAAAFFLLPFAAIIAPWTARNYVTYNRLIIIDTLGPVNLWMAMSDAVNAGRGEGEAKAILAAIPQEERQAFVSADIRRILNEEPWRLTRNFWPHFQHIWKAQFIEDYFVKVSFFTRPLREVWIIGALGDALWLIFSAASVFALAARPHEGGFRLLALGWIAYSCLTVMLIHVEPRYLLPIWLFMALYGAATLGALWNWLALRQLQLHEWTRLQDLGSRAVHHSAFVVHCWARVLSFSASAAPILAPSRVILASSAHWRLASSRLGPRARSGDGARGDAGTLLGMASNRFLLRDAVHQLRRLGSHRNGVHSREPLGLARRTRTPLSEFPLCHLRRQHPICERLVRNGRTVGTDRAGIRCRPAPRDAGTRHQ